MRLLHLPQERHRVDAGGVRSPRERQEQGHAPVGDRGLGDQRRRSVRLSREFAGSRARSRHPVGSGSASRATGEQPAPPTIVARPGGPVVDRVHEGAADPRRVHPRRDHRRVVVAPSEPGADEGRLVVLVQARRGDVPPARDWRCDPGGWRRASPPGPVRGPPDPGGGGARPSRGRPAGPSPAPAPRPPRARPRPPGGVPSPAGRRPRPPPWPPARPAARCAVSARSRISHSPPPNSVEGQQRAGRDRRRDGRPAADPPGQPLRAALSGRAAIGSPRRKRRRSSARAAASA